MESYPLLFHPQPSSAYHSSGHLPHYQPNMVGTAQPFAGPHSSISEGFWGLKEEAKASSSDGHGAPRTELPFAVSEIEGAPAKKGETKKPRRPRYAFQTRSQVDILDDGYRWRKYGQKAVKNNKFPRSYYRCTYQGCNVKKQVQRLSKDEEIVVTTYEGVHTHPIEKSNDNFEHILNQMQIYSSF